MHCVPLSNSIMNFNHKNKQHTPFGPHSALTIRTVVWVQIVCDVSSIASRLCSDTFFMITSLYSFRFTTCLCTFICCLYHTQVSKAKGMELVALGCDHIVNHFWWCCET